MGHQSYRFVEGGIEYALEVRFWLETRRKNYQADLGT
jgi:hypothetical protein